MGHVAPSSILLVLARLATLGEVDAASHKPYSTEHTTTILYPQTPIAAETNILKHERHTSLSPSFGPETKPGPKFDAKRSLRGNARATPKIDLDLLRIRNCPECPGKTKKAHPTTLGDGKPRPRHTATP